MYVWVRHMQARSVGYASGRLDYTGKSCKVRLFVYYQILLSGYLSIITLYYGKLLEWSSNFHRRDVRMRLVTNIMKVRESGVGIPTKPLRHLCATFVSDWRLHQYSKLARTQKTLWGIQEGVANKPPLGEIRLRA